MAKSSLMPALRFTVAVTAAVVVAVSAGVVVALYFLFPGVRSHLGFVAAVAGGGAAIYAAYYAGLRVKLMYELERKQRSFDLASRLNQVATIEKRKTLEKAFNPGELNDREVYELVWSDPVLHSTATLLLNYFEDVSIAIQEEYADEDILFKALNWLVVSTYHRLAGYIRELRRIERQSTFVIQVERLANPWREGRSLLTKKKLTHDLPE